MFFAFVVLRKCLLFFYCEMKRSQFHHQKLDCARLTVQMLLNLNEFSKSTFVFKPTISLSFGMSRLMSIVKRQLG